jgi:hypothetical protein
MVLDFIGEKKKIKYNQSLENCWGPSFCPFFHETRRLFDSGFQITWTWQFRFDSELGFRTPKNGQFFDFSLLINFSQIPGGY